MDRSAGLPRGTLPAQARPDATVPRGWGAPVRRPALPAGVVRGSLACRRHPAEHANRDRGPLQGRRRRSDDDPRQDRARPKRARPRSARPWKAPVLPASAGL